MTNAYNDEHVQVNRGTRAWFLLIVVSFLIRILYSVARNGVICDSYMFR